MLPEELGIDEDDANEFKMHTKNILSEIQRSKYTRNRNGRIMRLNQPNSKVICAFLNTKGGRVFLGVNDNGEVKGLKLTEFQLDHVILSLNHTLEAFTPPVPPHLIKFKVIKVGGVAEDFEQNLHDTSNIFIEEAPGTLEHVVGKPFCYCTQSQNHHSSQYLIIITVKKGDKDIWYQNDEGLVYVRRNGSNMLLSMDKLRQFRENQFISKPLPLPVYHSEATLWDRLREIFLDFIFSGSKMSHNKMQ